MKLLHIDSSILGENSVSLATELREQSQPIARPIDSSPSKACYMARRFLKYSAGRMAELAGHPRGGGTSGTPRDRAGAA